MEKHAVSIRKSAMNYGLILGGVSSLITALIYVVNLELFTKWWLAIFFILLTLALAIVSVAKAKGMLNGFISFKEAFTVYFITVALGFFISTLVMILIFVLIDPEAAATLQERTVEMTQEMMQQFGAPQAEIDKQIANLEGQNNYSIGSQLKSYVFGLAFMSVFGLMIALIFRRKDPNSPL